MTAVRGHDGEVASGVAAVPAGAGPVSVGSAGPSGPVGSPGRWSVTALVDEITDAARAEAAAAARRFAAIAELTERRCSSELAMERECWGVSGPADLAHPFIAHAFDYPEPRRPGAIQQAPTCGSNPDCAQPDADRRKCQSRMLIEAGSALRLAQNAA
jgi:hypothetical protein